MEVLLDLFSLPPEHLSDGDRGRGPDNHLWGDIRTLRGDGCLHLSGVVLPSGMRDGLDGVTKQQRTSPGSRGASRS